MVHFPQILSLSVFIIVFFHPKMSPVSQAYFLFPSQNSIPHTFFTENTLPTFLKQPRTDFYISIILYIYYIYTLHI